MTNTLLMLLLVVVAAFCDLRSGRIPNPLILTGVTIGLVFAYFNKGTEGLLMALAGFGLGFMLVMPGYLLRFSGAGDVKLMATLGIFSGPGVILVVFAASVVAGALFILLKILWRFVSGRDRSFQRYRMMLQTLLLTGQFIYLSSEQEPVLKQRLPMAPFYALGCLMVTLLPLIGIGG
ncbi:MAG: prepilin peptidase [Candidatus Thiodiazotropha sp.]